MTRCNRYNFLLEKPSHFGPPESRGGNFQAISEPGKKNMTLASIEFWLVNDGMLMSLIYDIPHMSWFQEL